MINKRGLSPKEFEELDEETFRYLMVFDAFIEPSGVKMDMLHHAHLCQTITLNNPNITKDFASKIKTTDYDFLNILDEGTTKERREKRAEKVNGSKKENTNNFLQARMDKMKELKANGKK
ncbi:TPA: hypothetical protein JG946_003761 [Enterobacter hormaechei subsp. steigerwaltii]|nr:hypothetical protein [Enterobacter hormaechei subsp. steigerwaltii]